MLGKSQSLYKPAALGATVSSSTYGQTIPVIFGRTKSALYMIWSANLRQGAAGAAAAGQGGKKSGGGLLKSEVPDYNQNCDFLIGHNPIVTPLQAWVNQNTLYPLNFETYTGTVGWQASSLTIPDDEFYAVIGLTLGGAYAVNFNDYGGPGAQALTGSWQIPLWNGCYAAPDPGLAGTDRFAKLYYLWQPSMGNVIQLPEDDAFIGAGTRTITVYYAQKDPEDGSVYTKQVGTSGVPALALRLYFEPVLGNGPEFEGDDSFSGQPLNTQQILYPHYAGLGSPDYDVGATQTPPDVRFEFLATYPLYSTGDCDFADMIEDIFKMGWHQAALGLSYNYAQIQRGLGCFDWPGATQNTTTNIISPGATTFPYYRPNTQNNVLVAITNPGATSSGGSPATVSGGISDSTGNTYVPTLPDGLNGQIWYAVPCAAALDNVVTVPQAAGYGSQTSVLEIAGADVVDTALNTIDTELYNSGSVDNITSGSGTFSWSSFPTSGWIASLQLYVDISGNDAGEFVVSVNVAGVAVATFTTTVTNTGDSSNSTSPLPQSLTAPGVPYPNSESALTYTVVSNTFPDTTTFSLSLLMVIVSDNPCAYVGWPTYPPGTTGIYGQPYYGCLGDDFQACVLGAGVGGVALPRDVVATNSEVISSIALELIGVGPDPYFPVLQSETLPDWGCTIQVVCGGQQTNVAMVPGTVYTVDISPPVSVVEGAIAFSLQAIAAASQWYDDVEYSGGEYGTYSTPPFPMIAVNLSPTGDTVDAGINTFVANTAYSTSSRTVELTTSNPYGTPAYLLAVANYAPGAIAANMPEQQHWTKLLDFDQGATNYIAYYQIVYRQGTYSFTADLTPSGASPNYVALLAFKCSQPPSFPRSLGNILDSTSLNLCRQQCRANGLWGSLVMDQQQKASDWLSDLYTAMNAAPVWSGFTLKSIPLSEVSAVGNGAVYVAPTASGPVAAISESDLLGEGADPPITVTRKAQVDVPNLLQIQHPARVAEYDNVVVSQPETGSLALYGPRKDSPKTMNMIQDPAVARMVLGVMVRRQNYLRNSYSFKLNARWKLLEPMDLIILPLSGTMPTVNGQPATSATIPVRLTKITEDDKYQLDCEAEPFIYGCCCPSDGFSLPVAPPVTQPQPYTPPVGADAGNVNTPIIFEPPPRLYGSTNQQQLWLVVSAPSAFYGGCVVYLSTDGGASYSEVGQISGSAVTGVTTADWPAAADPDTTNNLLLNLTESNGTLASYQVSDEDNFLYPCYVAGGAGDIPYELMSYAVATLTASNQYTLQATGGNHLRRAVFNMPTAGEGVDHPTGSRFAWLGPLGSATQEGILKLVEDPSWIGLTLYFKFAAYNNYAGPPESLSDCTAYTYTPSGSAGGVNPSGAPVQLFQINGS